MTWVKDSRFKNTYEYRGNGYQDKKPVRTVYSVSRNGKNGFQIWESQFAFKGKPSTLNFSGIKTKKSKIYSSEIEARKKAQEGKPLKV